MPELDLRYRLVGVDVDWESDLQQALVLVPVHVRLHHEGLAARRQTQGLDSSRLPEEIFDPDGCLARPARDNRDALGRAQVCLGMAVKRVDIPGWPFVGDIWMELEDVAEAPGGMTSRSATRSISETMWPLLSSSTLMWSFSRTRPSRTRATSDDGPSHQPKARQHRHGRAAQH